MLAQSTITPGARHAWAADTGWIPLSAVTTDSMKFPDTCNDGISDAYEYAFTSGLTTLGEDADVDLGVGDPWHKSTLVPDSYAADSAQRPPAPPTTPPPPSASSGWVR